MPYIAWWLIDAPFVQHLNAFSNLNLRFQWGNEEAKLVTFAFASVRLARQYRPRNVWRQ
ncbi:hypothetical protein [Fibrella arboris]|uniref:hypothetical protein n=1 Tax=Fibrella arboris TaxID=3242486 RepID=UPI0035228792